MQPFTYPFPVKPVRMVVAFIAAAGAMLGTGIVAGLIGALAEVYARKHGGDEILVATISELFAYTVTFAAAIVTLWMFRDKTDPRGFAETLGMRFKDLFGNLRQAFRVVGWAFVYFAAAFAVIYVVYLFPMPKPYSPAGAAAEEMRGVEFALFGVMAVFLAPLLEELFFRGMVQNMLRAVLRGKPSEDGTACHCVWMRDTLAVVITGAVFALLHGTVSGFPPLFIMGTAMGLAYRRTGSIWTSMSVHFLNNLVATTLIALSLGS